MTPSPKRIPTRPWRRKPSPFHQIARLTLDRISRIRREPALRLQFIAWNDLLDEMGERIEQLYDERIYNRPEPQLMERTSPCNESSTP